MKTPWVWFDIENTPHAHFLRPFVDRARKLALVRITARAQAQTLALAAHLGLDAIPIGAGDRDGSMGKVVGVVGRAMRLVWWVLRQGRPAVLVCCSRSGCIAAKLLGVPTIVILDYEHAELRAFSLATSLWMPDVLRAVTLPAHAARVVRFFAGLKENLYLDGERIERRTERAALGVADSERLVISRPPAEAAHYAGDASWRLWLAVTDRLARLPATKVLVISRNAAQRTKIAGELADLPALTLLDRIVDGPRTIAAADLVIGGGGTMNREAAVLGTPVWSVFSGARPHVDEVLAAEGRLWWIEDDETAATLAPPPIVRGASRGPFPEGLDEIAAEMESHILAAQRA